MPSARFDQYYRYEPLAAMLREYAAAYPQLMQLQSIGKSYEGRDILLATITCQASGAAHDKPAFWVDGNIHAAELAGSSACLYFIDTLLSGFGSDPDITRSLTTRTFYICPRVNPDGAEWALADKPTLIRSSTRPYPYAEEPLGGLRAQDIDGDGKILSMRIVDPDGPWKISAVEPRLMVAREPAEIGGVYYRILPEGIIEHYDGALIPLQTKKEGLDLNRNFPARWQEEHLQQGAGAYPASEPEVHAIVDFIAHQPNIWGGVTFHTYSGVLLRPYSYQSDEEFPPEDLWTFTKIGAKGTELTGYPVASAFDAFRYHPKKVITGALDDWLYDNLGAFAWTVEIWSPQRQAGIHDYKFIDWYREHPFEDDLKMLAWNDTALKGQGFVDWYEFDHPQLGKIELGGWDNLYSFWNPPPSLLEQEIQRFPAWLVWQSLLSPRLEFHKIHVETLSNYRYLVQMVVRNSGWLPTYVTKKAQEKQLRGLVCEIILAENASLLSGKHREELPHLEGRAYKGSTPTGWAGLSADPTEDRAKIEWLIHAPTAGKITVIARHARAGKISAQIELPPQQL